MRVSYIFNGMSDMIKDIPSSTPIIVNAVTVKNCDMYANDKINAA
jgi:hypothetical protein